MTAGGTIDIGGLFFSWTGAVPYLFENLSLRFESGETVCLIGPNGVGKTTLLELILGWRTPSAGGLSVSGRSVAKIPGRERGRLMALVPQDERLSFPYSALEYVLLGRAPYLSPLSPPSETDRDMAYRVMDRVGIPELAHRPITNLSGGEKRLVLITRALLQEPQVLLLDEPGNHLDPANRERVISILKDLRDTGITLILSSHEPDLVTRLADKVVLIHSDKVPEIGEPEDMISAEKLGALYGVDVKIAMVDGRRVILWGAK